MLAQSWQIILLTYTHIKSNMAIKWCEPNQMQRFRIMNSYPLKFMMKLNTLRKVHQLNVIAMYQKVTIFTIITERKRINFLLNSNKEFVLCESFRLLEFKVIGTSFLKELIPKIRHFHPLIRSFVFLSFSRSPFDPFHMAVIKCNKRNPHLFALLVLMIMKCIMMESHLNSISCDCHCQSQCQKVVHKIKHVNELSMNAQFTSAQRAISVHLNGNHRR